MHGVLLGMLSFGAQCPAWFVAVPQAWPTHVGGDGRGYSGVKVAANALSWPLSALRMADLITGAEQPHRTGDPAVGHQADAGVFAVPGTRVDVVCDHPALDGPQRDAASGVQGGYLPGALLAPGGEDQCRAGGGRAVDAHCVHARHPPRRRVPVDQPRPHRVDRMVDGGLGGEYLGHLAPPDRSVTPTLRSRRPDGLDELHLASGTKPAEVAASVRSYVERWAARYCDGVTPVWRLKSRIRCAWSNHPSSAALSAHPTDPWTSMCLEQPAHPQNAGERARAEADLLCELSVQVTVAHPEPRRDVRDRPGRSAESCRTAASHRASALRSNGSGVLRVASTTSSACAGVRQVASSPPQGGGPRPCPQQIHHPAPQRGRREPESGPAADRGGDDPDAVRLAQGLVDDRPVVRADQETGLGDQSGALADRGLPDGVAEDHGRHGRPGRSDPLSDPGDTTTREPHPLDEAARSHRRPGAARTRTRLDRTEPTGATSPRQRIGHDHDIDGAPRSLTGSLSSIRPRRLGFRLVSQPTSFRL